MNIKKKVKNDGNGRRLSIRSVQQTEMMMMLLMMMMTMMMMMMMTMIMMMMIMTTTMRGRRRRRRRWRGDKREERAESGGQQEASDKGMEKRARYQQRHPGSLKRRQHRNQIYRRRSVSRANIGAGVGDISAADDLVDGEISAAAANRRNFSGGAPSTTSIGTAASAVHVGAVAGGIPVTPDASDGGTLLSRILCESRELLLQRQV
jgi:hypothetical protein